MPFIKRKDTEKDIVQSSISRRISYDLEANVVRSDGNDFDPFCFSLSITHQVVIHMRLSGYLIQPLLTTFIPEESCLLAFRSWMAVLYL